MREQFACDQALFLPLREGLDLRIDPLSEIVSGKAVQVVAVVEVPPPVGVSGCKSCD